MSASMSSTTNSILFHPPGTGLTPSGMGRPPSSPVRSGAGGGFPGRRSAKAGAALERRIKPKCVIARPFLATRVRERVNPCAKLSSEFRTIWRTSCLRPRLGRAEAQKPSCPGSHDTSWQAPALRLVRWLVGRRVHLRMSAGTVGPPRTRRRLGAPGLAMLQATRAWPAKRRECGSSHSPFRTGRSAHVRETRQEIETFGVLTQQFNREHHPDRTI
jgi:hypothetical protein